MFERDRKVCHSTWKTTEMALIQRRLFSSSSTTLGSVALVTGASIGRAVCNLLAKRDGVNIIASDVRKDYADETVKELETRRASSLTQSVSGSQCLFEGFFERAL